MNRQQLRELQAPLKARYREDPSSASLILQAQGAIGSQNVSCSVSTDNGAVEAGLHPATGGDGTLACSGDILLQALVACAGVTLKAVATAMDIAIRGGTVRAEGDLDFRGTLGVEKTAAVGFQNIRLYFDLDTDADAEQLESLLKLTERYCVVYKTLCNPPKISVSHQVSDGPERAEMR